MSTTKRPIRRALGTALVGGLAGWAGVVAIGLQLSAASPRNVGFDLELLLQAGRDFAAGRSPYAPELIGGSAPAATSLFYSYPPPLGQVLSIVAGVPSAAMLFVWAGLSVVGLLAVTEGLRRRYAPERNRPVVLAVVTAAAPLALPFAVGMLFGNYDVFFPLLYGAMLLAVVAPSGATALAGGVALTFAVLKIHPASLGLWFLVRAARERTTAGRVNSGRVVIVAVGSAFMIVAVSVALGGPVVWAEYGRVIGASTHAVIIDPRNASPAALFASALGGGDEMARTLHVGVGIAALGITAWAAHRRSDPVESVAWATAASLVTLSVTWYHYPTAFIPIAIAAGLRAQGAPTSRVRALIVATVVVGALAIALLPLLWVAIGLMMIAVRVSASDPDSTTGRDADSSNRAITGRPRRSHDQLRQTEA